MKKPPVQAIIIEGVYNLLRANPTMIEDVNARDHVKNVRSATGPSGDTCAVQNSKQAHTQTRVKQYINMRTQHESAQTR